MNADGEVGGRRMAERKRHCKREDGSDTDADSDVSEKPFWETDVFLAELMHQVLNAANINLADHIGERFYTNNTQTTLPARIYDALVKHWDGPQDESGERNEDLLMKRDAWARAKRSPGVGASVERGEQRGSAS